MPPTSTKDAAKDPPASAKPAAVVKTIEEQVQLVRVFRLLAFEIPQQLIDRKLEVRRVTSEYVA